MRRRLHRRQEVSQDEPSRPDAARGPGPPNRTHESSVGRCLSRRPPLGHRRLECPSDLAMAAVIGMQTVSPSDKVARPKQPIRLDDRDTADGAVSRVAPQCPTRPARRTCQRNGKGVSCSAPSLVSGVLGVGTGFFTSHAPPRAPGMSGPEGPVPHSPAIARLPASTPDWLCNGNHAVRPVRRCCCCPRLTKSRSPQTRTGF